MNLISVVSAERKPAFSHFFMIYTFKLAQAHPPVDGNSLSVDWNIVGKEFKALQIRSPGLDDEMETRIEAVIGSDKEKRIDGALKYAERLDTKLNSSPRGHAFVNGKHFSLDDVSFPPLVMSSIEDAFQEFMKNLQVELNKQLQHIQEEVSWIRVSLIAQVTRLQQTYTGKLTDDDASRLGTYFYDLPSTHLRRSRYIFPATGQLHISNLPELFGETGFLPENDSYIYPCTQHIL